MVHPYSSIDTTAAYFIYLFFCDFKFQLPVQLNEDMAQEHMNGAPNETQTNSLLVQRFNYYAADASLFGIK